MATSSIIERIRVDNPEALEEYLAAMERQEREVHPQTEEERSSVVSDPTRIRTFMEKALRLAEENQ